MWYFVFLFHAQFANLHVNAGFLESFLPVLGGANFHIISDILEPKTK